MDIEFRPNAQKAGSLGAIEGNVDKLVVRCMKGRGRSWRWRGLRGMLAICQCKSQLRTLAFHFESVDIPKKPVRRISALSVDYSERIQKSMPVFSGPHQARLWAQSLHRYVHGQ